MKTNKQLFLIILTIALLSCSSPRYIYDKQSYERQKELKANRSGNVVGDVLLTIASFIFSVAVETDAMYIPEGKEFKKFKLINPTKDTVYVNMLTDVTWDNENFCDFMDIRIPPEKQCKILVPIGIDYNIYFGDTDNPEEDEMIGINTGNTRKLNLYPGITVDTIINNELENFPE